MQSQNEPNHIYFDVEVVNHDLSGEPRPITNYVDTRVQSFIKTPSNYYLSVVRFSLDTPTLPVFYPSVLLGQADPNKLVYQISVKSGSSYYTDNVTYIPSNTTVSTPAPPLINQDTSTDYYSVYSIQKWITMLNQTLYSLCFNNGLETAFFKYNVDNSLIELYIPKTFISSNVKIYVNDQLKIILNTFDFNCEYNATLGKAWQIQYSNFITDPKIVDTIDYYVMKQERTTLALYNPVRSIVFTTSLIPVFSSLTAPPVVLGSSRLSGTSSSANILPVITDFEVLTQNGSSYLNNVLYEPTAEYRMIDLVGNTELNQISISCSWKDKGGNLHPLYLGYGCAFSAKLMFRDKNFN